MSGLYAWEAGDAVNAARRAQDDAASTYDAQLTALLKEYAGRRSAAAQLVRQVADLAVGHAAEADRRAQQLLETLSAGQSAIVERLEKQLDDSRKHGERLMRSLDEKRALVEERQQDGEEDATAAGAAGPDAEPGGCRGAGAGQLVPRRDRGPAGVPDPARTGGDPVSPRTVVLIFALSFTSAFAASFVVTWVLR